MSNGSLAEKVFRSIEEDILKGVLQPEEVLSENKLSAAMGVSRTPVREALRRLEQAGLVRQEPGKGAVVQGVTTADLIDIYDIRLRIEGMAVRDCADMITPEQLAELESLVELQEFYTERADADKLHEIDSQFHAKIYECCTRRVLTDVLSGLHHRVERYRLMSVQSPERASCMAQEHRAILGALKAHDAQLADSLMVEHIKNARDSLALNVKEDE